MLGDTKGGEGESHGWEGGGGEGMGEGVTGVVNILSLMVLTVIQGCYSATGFSEFL